MMISLVKKMFLNYPRLANCAVYGSLYVGAEFSQQIIVRKVMVEPGKEKPIDKHALGRYFIIGSIVNANILYTWYKWLDMKYKGTRSKIIAKKIVLDQFLMTPPLYVMFYVSMSLMEGRPDIFKECREKLANTFLTSCLFWLPAQMINFMYVPNSARVVYIGVCSFAWVNILCYFKRCGSDFE